MSYVNLFGGEWSNGVKAFLQFAVKMIKNKITGGHSSKTLVKFAATSEVR